MTMVGIVMGTTIIRLSDFHGTMAKYKKCSFLSATSGGWTEWSPWSPCSAECVHRRFRDCANPRPANGGALCKGRDAAAEGCSGDMCRGRTHSFFESDFHQSSRFILIGKKYITYDASFANKNAL